MGVAILNVTEQPYCTSAQLEARTILAGRLTNILLLKGTQARVHVRRVGV